MLLLLLNFLALVFGMFDDYVLAQTLAQQPTATSPHQQSNPLPNRAEETLIEANQLFQEGIARFNLSEFRAALALWEESLSLFRADNARASFFKESRQGESNTLGGLGSVYIVLGEYDRAIDFHQQQLGIAQEIGYHRGESNALGNLGSAYYSLSEYDRAIDLYQQQLDIAQEIGHQRGEANALGGLGTAYYSLGQYDRAIDLYQQQLNITGEIGHRRGEANALGGLGVLYSVLGEYGRAIGFHQQQLDITQEIGDRRGEATSLGGLGSAYYFLGEYGRAIDLYQQQLDIKREIGDRRGEVFSLGNLGSAYFFLNKYNRAIDLYQQQLDITGEIGDQRGEANALSGLGGVYSVLGEYGRAIDLYQQQLDIYREIGDPRGESSSLLNLGVVFHTLNDLSAAAQHFQASAQVKEALHTNKLSNANRLSLLDSQQKTYHLWQVTLMALDQPKAALTVSERGRAQALAVSMTRSLSRETETFEPPAPLTLELIQSIAVQQQATLVEYSVLPSGRILIWVIQPDGTIYSTESDAAALDDSLIDTTGLFASLGHNSRGGELPETPLSTLVQDTQTSLTRGSSSDSPLSRQQLDTQLQQLHEALIEPIAQWLPKDDQQRVIFIPHRELFRVPFTALRDSNGNYLIQNHTILTAPSIQSLDLARQHRTRIQSVNMTDALIVGNPHFPDTLTTAYGWHPLPGAEREARNVSTHLSQHLGKSPTVLLHDQATETQVREQLHSARFIHLATHGNLVSINEKVGLPGVQYSFLPGLLALAASDQDDGSLTADELRDLTRTNPLNAELVVLSACQTGQGRITSDGVDGLSRTLLTAGVPTMLVSLWNASDHHTVNLMDEFYRQFLKEGEDKAQALRQAMLQMIEQGDDNPQHWAAFTLVGEAE